MVSTQPVVSHKTLSAYEAFLDELVGALEGAEKPHPQAAPSHTVLFAITLKVLRLADSLRGLLLTRHGRETGPNLRSVLQAYVNLKFITTDANAEGAAIRFQMHLDRVRQNLKFHLVREDKSSDGFPVITETQWEEDELVNAQRRSELLEWMGDHNVTELAPFRPGTDKKGAPLNPREDTWTGMSDRELFEFCGETDAWRYYVLFSDESHTNVGGIGNLMNEVNQGVANLGDEEGEQSLWLGAKYAYLSVLMLDRHFGLGIGDAVEAAFDRFGDVLIAAVGARPPEL